MATIVWGGDYKAARNGLNIANQCRAIKDAGTCLSKVRRRCSSQPRASGPAQFPSSRTACCPALGCTRQAGARCLAQAQGPRRWQPPLTTRAPS
jgi:hypothetical protein